MSPRTTIAVFAVLLAVIVLGRVRRDPVPDQAPAPEGVVTTSTATGGGRVPKRQVGPLAATMNEPLLGTPAIDLNARLATRRRIEREGARVYLDSMLATTDSVVIRWGRDHAPTLTVRFEPDSALGGWQGALDDAKVGMRSWEGNPSGFSFRESTDSVVDIVVRWSLMMGEKSQLGLTSVTWGADGVIQNAIVTLGLLQNPDSLAAPPSIRRRVAAHEFGHVFGLAHSGRLQDLMHSTSPVPTPSRRDLATLQLLYALTPGPVRTP